MERVSNSEKGMVPSSMLSIIGGGLMVASGLVVISMMAMWPQFGGMPGYGMGGMRGGWGMMSSTLMWSSVGTVSALTIGLGAILIVGGYLMQKPESAGTLGAAILVTSIVGLIGMSGFFIGPVIGIIAGILALTKK